LIRLYTTIAGPDQLSPRDQAALVAQLQVGLREDGQHEAARKDIIMLLNKLHEREDVTYRTRTEVEAILASIDVESRPQPPIDTETENGPADTDRTTLDRPSNVDLRTEPDDHRVTAIAPADELTSIETSGKSSDRPVASAMKTTPAPSVKPPLFQRLSRRTKIALIAGTVALVAVIAAAVAIPAIVGHRPSERTYLAQTVLPFTGLSFPVGVAVDAAGTLYVTDEGNNRVLMLPAGSVAQVVLPFTGLNKPRGVAVDAAGNLYVIDKFNNRVLKLPAGSATQEVLSFTGLNQPNGVAVDAAGNLYVTDTLNHRVLKQPAGSTTQVVLSFTGLNQPNGVAVDAAGNLYVTDFNNRVLKLPAGAAVQEVLPFTGLNDPHGVAVDAAGNLYVTDYHWGDDFKNTRVLKLPAGSATQEVLPFIGLGNPDGVAVDAAGNLYVTDHLINRVVKLPVR
jgi:serine/threonine-protein kinase